MDTTSGYIDAVNRCTGAAAFKASRRPGAGVEIGTANNVTPSSLSSLLTAYPPLADTGELEVQFSATSYRVLSDSVQILTRIDVVEFSLG